MTASTHSTHAAAGLPALLRWPLAFALVTIAIAVGMAFPPDAWFRTLEKPAFQPPNSWFGPVWTVLYTLMAIAFARILSFPQAQRRTAVHLFLLQLALNAAWSPLFFGAQAVGAALVLMLLLIVCVLLTIRLFARMDRVAARLLWPYPVWLGYALALNAAIWWLNR